MLLKIATASRLNSKRWNNKTVDWYDLVKRLETPTKSMETLSEFKKLDKKEQTELKDVGGFVGGELNQGKRTKSSVLSRSLITLDLDNIPSGDTQTVIDKVKSLGFTYCVYSTRKHEKEAPRLRVLFPLVREIEADKYEPAARKIAQKIGLQYCDKTTFDVSRLMFYPSICCDGDYIFETATGKTLDADEILKEYKNYKDVSEWASYDEIKHRASTTAKQEDPREKSGVIGAFCRTYPISRAIDEFLKDIYTPTDKDGRYTYTGATTYGGAIVFDDLFLYSYHAHDPAQGQLLNAFDLVRIHLYNSDTKQALAKLCELEDVRAELTAELFSDLDVEEVKASEALSYNKKGQLLPTLNNIQIILNTDESFKNNVFYNKLSDTIEKKRTDLNKSSLPWLWRDDKELIEPWADIDDKFFRSYMQKYSEDFKDKDLNAAIDMYAYKHSYHPIRDLIKSKPWDGVRRVNSFFIDFLGCEPNEYHKEAAGLLFRMGAARVFYPGVKVDPMFIIYGEQGFGKSELVKRLAFNKYYSDSVGEFIGKGAMEALNGVWLVEIAELQAFNKSETNAIKNFLTKQKDNYRAAYDRRSMERKRQCVFIGTTNEQNYLKDWTGNRRFLPIDIQPINANKSIFEDLTEDYVQQLWAEGLEMYKQDKFLDIKNPISKTIWKELQEEHMEDDPRQGLIIEYLEKPIPKDWYELDELRRFNWLSGGYKDSDIYGGDVETMERTKVCLAEVLEEALNIPSAKADKRTRVEIGQILSTMEGWHKSSTQRFGEYGIQKAWLKRSERRSADRIVTING